MKSQAVFRFFVVFISLFPLFHLHSTAIHAQFKASDTERPTGGTTLGEKQTAYWECGLEVTARSGECKKIVGTVPVPVDWPEQKVKVVKEEISPYAKISHQLHPGGVKQMVVKVPTLLYGEKAVARVRYEVESYIQEAPKNTRGFKKPDLKEMQKDPLMRRYLQDSPQIEVKHKEIIAAAKALNKHADGEDGWKAAEEIYDWVRAEVKYVNGPLKGALAALRDKTGDCEELTSLFVAICRIKGIPARTVWVPEHCYAEFYLVDKNGVGHWFPCQTAGDRAFGEMPFQYIILQKGDSFETEIKKKKVKVRYLAETLTGEGSTGAPAHTFIREKVAE